MGCDIHLAVEMRSGNGWERVLPTPEVYDSWLAKQAVENPGDKYYSERVKVTWFDDRNYNLFAILANVRNDYDISPISEPRDLPDDLSAGVRRLVDGDTEDEERDDDNDIHLGDHSHSWLTLRELLDYDWNREFKEGGWVNPRNFILWRNEGRPKEWCKSVGGGRVEHLSWRDMKDYIERGYITFNDSARGYSCVFDSIGGERSHYAAYVEWPITCKDAAGRFYTQLLPELQKVGAPEDVRIVFAFDS